MQNAVAFANNDVITVAWSYGQKLEGCMGFAVYRIDAKGKETALPAVAVFPGFKRASTDTCEKFPIQKFYWKDVYARLVAEKTGERTFRYKIVPFEGEPGSLVPMHIPQVISNEVEISSRISDTMHAYFNRGLISTQSISRALQGKPSKKGLLDRIEKPTDTLRASLSGDMVEALTDFVGRAKSGGKLYAALYELHDQELVPLLEKAGKKLSIVLSNAMEQEVRPVGEPKAEVDGNQDARDRLTKTASAMFSRLLSNNQIGHNKFAVYVDKSGHARAVLLGSTNWTPTGLCAQTNNTIVLDNAKAAQRYLDYWKQLKADTQQAKTDPTALQGAVLRSWDGAAKDIPLGADGTLTSWFSPNTPKLRSSPTKNEKRPPDMADVVKAIDGAKHAVLFLVFYPGSPNVAQWAADAQRANKDLFVRGCVTNPSASESFYYELHGITPPKDGKGKQDSRVIAADALDDKSAPAGWMKEILSAGFAIIHDKVVVIDPFSDDCVVITGSHNLGHKASFNNDENLAIIRGNRKLAAAYASHVLDVYDHFAWRVAQKDPRQKGDGFLKVKPDAWQGKYFNADGSIRVAQLRFWLSALV
ncbi:MAG TPA: phospholipase D-like domain-containing protein [Candidatus Acidoferrales bacterium]|nr:phospholipase D-like domain-containing protein [Candidatus Acidoferrales bacterium]